MAANVFHSMESSQSIAGRFFSTIRDLAASMGKTDGRVTLFVMA
jgi:hypothetical protein